MIIKNKGHNFETQIGSNPESLVYFVDNLSPENNQIIKAIKELDKHFIFIKILEIEWDAFHKMYPNNYCKNPNHVLRIGYGYIEPILDTSINNLRRILSDIKEKQNNKQTKIGKAPVNLKYQIKQSIPQTTKNKSNKKP